MTTIKFQSFSSGSCGNSYFLGAFDEDGACISGIAIDAGISPKRVRQYLQADGLSQDDIQCVLITHDHHDHIGSLGSWCRKLCKPVWATPTLHRAMSRRYDTGPCIPGYRQILQEGWNEVVPGHVQARYFIVPHDATETVGYAICIEGYRFVIMTDIGKMTPQAMSFAKQASTVVIESNYDLDMLLNGPYTEELKRRIRGGSGHLSNAECAQAIGEFLHDGLDNIFLCHLSDHNNTAQAALETSRAVLETMSEGLGRQPRLSTLPRETPSPLFTL